MVGYDKGRDMRKAIIGAIWIGFILGILTFGMWSIAFGMGYTVGEFINDWNVYCVTTSTNCDIVANKFHQKLYGMQKAELLNIGIKEGERRNQGHRIVVYKEQGTRFCITTYYNKDLGRYMVKRYRYHGSLHELCKSYRPDYKYVAIYDINGGKRPVSRHLVKEGVLGH